MERRRGVLLDVCFELFLQFYVLCICAFDVTSAQKTEKKTKTMSIKYIGQVLIKKLHTLK